MQSYDVVIVGGGMVGLSLALALKDSKLQVAVLAEPHPMRALGKSPELRVSAINQASENLLKRLGTWKGIVSQRVAPYTHMSVWEQDSFAAIDFDHQQLHLPHLGHIIENQVVLNALGEQLLAADNVELVDDALTDLQLMPEKATAKLKSGKVISAALVVGTDGAQSMVRKLTGLPIRFKDYEHSAIVATVRTAEVHGNTARQVFTPFGPLAFLPLFEPHLCSIVWSQHTAKAQQLMQMDKADFDKALTAAFGATLGLCHLESERASYPLTMRYANQWLKDRVVLAGDAAHTIHPLAGQGANLGMMDAAALADALLNLHSQGVDIGLAKHLRPYERWRKTEAVKMIAAMESFKRLFDGNHPLKKLIRGLGMNTVDSLPIAKQIAIQLAVGSHQELAP
ncbi:FAD-dependent monooxygenase [Aliiglaciecola sp. CAU 1673]|uniref:FAD-dependent monooxygenase n=1 Tax=Aliiglaciecola sp. CAU 1673 TaxID=3032595 RepID=UPI0023DCA7F3|nr:FAD-dependent monooxygenase [Aliiglaciecola sp. CAU 1673]MDF2179453.1 FAD-dependent monooxygenase [Aliiglaciecola sp. CAU 1673]